MAVKEKRQGCSNSSSIALACLSWCCYGIKDIDLISPDTQYSFKHCYYILIYPCIILRYRSTVITDGLVILA
jgi:hypothetical protein